MTDLLITRPTQLTADMNRQHRVVQSNLRIHGMVDIPATELVLDWIAPLRTASLGE